MDGEFSVHTISPSSPRFFGEPLIIVGASKGQGSRYNGECYVLLERSAKTLYQIDISINSAAMPKDTVAVDLAFALDTALGAGKAEIADILHSRFQETEDWNLFARPFEYQEVEKTHLVQLWMMNKWQKEIRTICETCKCEALVDWLVTVMQVPTIAISRPGQQ
ncbi:MAG TPA: hypothetical protein VF450_04135 [Noviherbaspirillum sp.]